MDGRLGTPGVSSVATAQYRTVFETQEGKISLPGGLIIDGAKAYDVGNDPDQDVLRAGLLMGKITASNKYAPSILGVTTVAYADGDLTLTTSAGVAAYLVARIGTSGTCKLVGPSVAGGVVQVTSVAYTAVNTTTGVITVPDLNVAAISGSFICPSDGSEFPLTFIDEGDGVQVTDEYRQTRRDTEFNSAPIAGVIRSTQLVNWPSDTSLQAWIVQQLNNVAGGKFVFSHLY